MTLSTLSLLDQTELMQLAISNSQAGDSGAAIGYLKEAVSRPDTTGMAHFMLGAEYAQIKLYDRAVGEMEAALALDPALAIARLQLGLLWLTSGFGERASAVLTPLSELPETNALRHFGAGLCSLILDQFDAAVGALRAGIALNDSNPPLNHDMQMMIDEVAKLRAAVPETPAVADAQLAQQAQQGSETPSSEDDHHILLNAYTGNTSH